MPASRIYHFAIPLLGQFMVYYRSKKKKMETGVINENRKSKKKSELFLPYDFHEYNEIWLGHLNR